MSEPENKKKTTKQPRKSPFSYTENVAMNTEYTGMMQTPADDDYEIEAYEEMLDD